MDKKSYIENRAFLIKSLKNIRYSADVDKSLTRQRKAIIVDRVLSVVIFLEEQRDSYLSYTVVNDSVNFSYCKDTAKDPFTPKNRIKIKLGRYLSKFFTFEDYVVDYITKNVMAAVIPLTEFDKLVKVISGTDFAEYYRNTPTRTCMTGADNASKIMLYTKNPERVKLVTIDGYACRALLWVTDEGDKVLDRIYPSGHSLIPTIRKWASEQGYVLRSSPDNYVRCVQGQIALENNRVYKITLKDVRAYPFTDTFAFAKKNEKDHTIILSNDYAHGNMGLQNQHGGYIEFLNCLECDNKVMDGSQFTVRKGKKNIILCEGCFNTKVMRCNCCSEYILKEEAILASKASGQVVCKNCLTAYFDKCSCCDQHHKKNYSVLVNEEIMCFDCYSKTYVKCHCCERNDLKKTSKTTKKAQNKTYCKSCFDKMKTCEACTAAIFGGKETIVNDKVYCSYCARYKVKGADDKAIKNVSYVSNQDYTEIINYITVNHTVL